MKYYIIAGEASGDLHGSNLMKGLYTEDPQAQIRFWGGDMMEAVWKEGEKQQEQSQSPAEGQPSTGLVHHYRDDAVMGLWEVITRAGKLLKNLKNCKADILKSQPDVVILIDYPGFNFKIAEFAHKHGIKTFYYIAPKVWASREGRIKKLKAYVDRLYIVFPFEIPYFKSKGVDAEYVGNPLLDAIENSMAIRTDRAGFLRQNSLEDKPIIALLAGSRKAEINTMMPVLTEFVAKLKRLPRYRGHQYIVAGAPSRSIEDYQPFLDAAKEKYGDLGIRVIFGQTQSIIKQAEAAVVNSGTASLETAIIGTPQVVGYICNPLTYWVGRKIIKIHYLSLGNLILDRLAFRELIQSECSADNLVAEVRALIENTDYRQKMLSEYEAIRSALGGSGASSRVAKSMISRL